MIYFIGNKEMNICKIGYSSRPYRRIETLIKQSGFDLDIYGIYDGDISLERIVHDLHDKARLKGEWYKLSDLPNEIMSFGTISFGNIKVFYNKEDGYIYLSSLLAYINKIRCLYKMNPFNYSTWAKSNEGFIKSFNIPIKENYIKRVHPFIALELLRNTHADFKIILYKNMDLFKDLIPRDEQNKILL